MKRLVKKVKIGTKIFGLAMSMLILLTALSYLTYTRTVKVTNELIKVTDYLVPFENLITLIDTHTLEQEIHLGRIWRLYETELADTEHLHREEKAFEERGRMVDLEVEAAIRLLNEAVYHVELKSDIIEFIHIRSILEDIEQEHQQFHDHALRIMQLLRDNEKDDAHLLQNELEQEELDLANEIEAVLSEISEFTKHSAQVMEKHERDVLELIRILLPIAILIGLFCAAMVTIGLMRPVKTLVNGTKAVVQGNLEVNLPITSRDEIGELSGIFNSMVREIREKERIKATFGQYVDPRIVDSLLHTSGSDIDRVEKKIMTVFFSDVADFSAISELLTPGGLVSLINQYLTLATEPITRYSGVIDQFIGDAVVAFWGPPFASAEDHARLACEAALEQFIQLEKLRRRMPDLMGFQKGLPEVNIRIGLATGELIVGNIGSEQLQSYTVLGNTKNVAEELESANKIYGTRILITEATKDLAARAIETRYIDRLHLAGFSQPVQIFELLSCKGELESDAAEMRDIFEEGLRLYRKQEWGLAQTRFESCLKLTTHDKAAALYLTRIRFFKENPPGDDWDGVWRSSRTYDPAKRRTKQ
ncbi:adenylate/guanylate cyclase domain-containing protein [Desulfococcaceae bacterium HSG8]|nr:adenylate/guanylate cyclase domain-containing protein [Desulfococcaceae bacterium HSG8]